MGAWYERIDKETVLALLRVVGIAVGAALSLLGGASVVETRAAEDLAYSEAGAKLGNAKAEKFGIYDTFGDFATAVEVRKAACNTALEALRRHPKDAADLEAAWSACYSGEDPE